MYTETVTVKHVEAQMVTIDDAFQDAFNLLGVLRIPQHLLNVVQGAQWARRLDYLDDLKVVRPLWSCILLRNCSLRLMQDAVFLLTRCIAAGGAGAEGAQ